MSIVEKLRDGLKYWEPRLVQGMGPPENGLDEFYVSVPLPDGYKAPIKVVRPKDNQSTSQRPLIVLFHGGGFMAGSAEMVTRPARDFAERFGAVVVGATYRLAPEHKFPTQFQDAWDTLIWLSTAGLETLGAHPERGFIVGGVSAGGTLAAAIEQQSVDRNLIPPLTGAYICIPMLLTDEIVPQKYRDQWTSRKDNADDPAATKELLEQTMVSFDPDVKSPLFSPFSAPNPHKGLPPVYIQVGGRDPLRDDGLLYEKALKDNGVRTRLDNYAEIGHSAWTIFSDGSSPKELAPNSMRAMEWLLGNGLK
ncbi:hypothetical protein QQS21_005509 [Conoideocrella luteorostrata]|uniref:Alpha/beta hydrolase fold-3 domain-containing protein n=1 Tax=Conoideocrella luteorostrata TaxID=1105319 RepID=A0AAJ0CPN1_9HYPO|nr:hypothetical protein QQS21_005509 [Conoideocrella luteorostrata]